MDNTFKLYADGFETVISDAERQHWAKASTISLPLDTEVVAVDALDHSPPGGIIASMDNGMVSDGSWKCTNKYEDGWKERSFDDNHWPSAANIGQNGVDPWGEIKNISPNAEWIWTSDHMSETSDPDKHIYCRKNITNTSEISKTIPVTGLNFELVSYNVKY